MALSGSVYGTTNNQFIKPRLAWQGVQDRAGNYTDLTVTLSYSRTNTGYTTAGLWAGSITVGTVTQTHSQRISITYQSDTVAMTAVFRVPHSPDGTCQVAISAAGAIATASLSATQIGRTVTLPTIPRASALAATSAAVGQTVLLAVTRYAEGFTHAVSWAFGSLTGWVGAGGETSQTPVLHRDTALPFVLPEAFYTQLPDSRSGPVTFTCHTYDGQTLLGTAQAEATVSVDPQWAPLLTGTLADENPATLALTGDARVLVRYRSHARVTLQAQARKEAALAAVAVNGIPGQSVAFPQVQTDTFLCTAADSRGLETACTLRAPVVAYVELTNDARCSRTDPVSGRASLVLQGDCYTGSFGLRDNALTAQVWVEDRVYPVALTLEENRYRGELLLEGLDYRRSHSLRVTVADCLDTVEKTLTVGQGVPVFDWGEGDFAFHVPVTCDGSLSGLYIRTVPAGDFTLATKFTDPAQTGVQPVLVFASGLMTVAQATAQAITGLEAQPLGGGLFRVTLTQPGAAALLSPEPIEIQ